MAPAPRTSSTRWPSPRRGRGCSPRARKKRQKAQTIQNGCGLPSNAPVSPSPVAATMPGDPRLRASDADRERTSQLLREHHGVGRLTAEEFQERLEKVFQARTLGELDALLADLPAIDLYQLPSAALP